MSLNRVLLPAPFGPMIDRISPAAAVKLTSLTATSPPNDFVTPSTASRLTGASSGPAGER